MLAPMTIRPSRVGCASASSVTTVAMTIGTPPSIAVGLVCQRSPWGFATAPMRRGHAPAAGAHTGEGRRATAPGGDTRMRDRARRVRMAHQQEQRLHHIADIPEAARLSSVSIDRERLFVERLADKRRYDHPVAADLPRANGIEQPGDDSWKLLFTVVGHSEKLVDRLRTCVAPPSFGGGTDDEV